MKEQKTVFLACEGDSWFRRNEESLEVRLKAPDAVLDLVATCQLSPGSILEIGCSNGWRLERLRMLTGAVCSGVEPSKAAVEYGVIRFPELSLKCGTADALPFRSESFDLVIFGFCLYVCDRRDLFVIAAEAARVLRPGGYLAILDFDSPVPHRNAFLHTPGMHSFKMTYESMFLWNPAFRLHAKLRQGHSGQAHPSPDEAVAATLLRYEPDTAYIEGPLFEEIKLGR